MSNPIEEVNGSLRDAAAGLRRHAADVMVVARDLEGMQVFYAPASSMPLHEAALDRLRSLLNAYPDSVEPGDWSLAHKLRLLAVAFDIVDINRGVYNETDIQTDLRTAANLLEGMTR